MLNEKSNTIARDPKLTPAQDFYGLRREGIGLIEKMGSGFWTDYNAHDPGITILDELCYAITDLAYRAGWDIKDILTGPKQKENEPPFPDQAFFTAREILTVNPWTPEDFRRLLIDLPEVRNAWIFCKECACDAYYYAWCEYDRLSMAYEKPEQRSGITNLKTVKPLGVYEALIELESTPENGDLNDRKIEQTYIFFDSENDTDHPFTMELRFPRWGMEQEMERQLFRNGTIEGWAITFFGSSRIYNIMEESGDESMDSHLRKNWNRVFYADFRVGIKLEDSSVGYVIRRVSVRLFGDSFVKNTISFDDLKRVLENKIPGARIKNFIHTKANFIGRYRDKFNAALKSIFAAKERLHEHRNLSEDYCRIRVIDIEEIAVCADIELSPEADIERVQAEIWFRIENYFNPALKFYSLQEMLDSGNPMEEIFNGPELDSGFIKNKDLKEANLKRELRVSDLINILMDIDGIIAVNSMRLTKYDSEGNIVKGVADPSLDENGNLIFDPSKSAASWVLYLKERHLPRLYLNGSCFLFYKNGLPFKPDINETWDILIQLQGNAGAPKSDSESTNPVLPRGEYLNPGDYHSLQNDFPLVYGIGPERLPSHVSDERRSQARQLKAYLMVFEQILANAFAQIAHTADLFSLNLQITRTYFIRKLSGLIIDNYEEIVTSPDLTELEALMESEQEFLDRRNRFLDHLMARFGEEFREHAQILNTTDGRQEALKKLIEDKIFFIANYRDISHDRGRSFNYRKMPSSRDNQAGIKNRVNLMAGVPRFTIKADFDDLGEDTFRVKINLLKSEVFMFKCFVTVSARTEEEAFSLVENAAKLRMSYATNFDIYRRDDGFGLQLEGSITQGHGESEIRFDTEAEALKLQNDLQYWAIMERIIVVEHILLRPKFPGDALYPACNEGDCKTCGEEDPYSFRYTFVIPAIPETFAENLEIRGYIETIIRREIPAHLLGKICWVAAGDQSIEVCNPAIGEISALLLKQKITENSEDACGCARVIYDVFHDIFQDWFEANALKFFSPGEVAGQLTEQFNQVKETDFACKFSPADALTEIRKVVVNYFASEALKGWKFEKFEEAWMNWLRSNSRFDWTEERLHDRIESILAKGFDPGPDKIAAPPSFESCACQILENYGGAFHEWMNQNFEKESSLKKFEAFVPSEIKDLICPNYKFTTEAIEAVSKLLAERYNRYQEVSFFLKTVVTRLAELRNIYPVATLHDWNEGNDQNPVRLGKSALGGM